MRSDTRICWSSKTPGDHESQGHRSRAHRDKSEWLFLGILHVGIGPVKKIYFMFPDIYISACFAVSRLISWASVGRGWAGNLAIPSWYYYPLYHRTTSTTSHKGAQCALGTELCIVLSSVSRYWIKRTEEKNKNKSAWITKRNLEKI